MEFLKITIDFYWIVRDVRFTRLGDLFYIKQSLLVAANEEIMFAT